MRLIFPILMMSALPAVAQDTSVPLPFECAGENPDWWMTITEDGTVFEALGAAQTDLDIAWETLAEGADWPRVLTLIGRGTSAIVIIEAPAEDSIPSAF